MWNTHPSPDRQHHHGALSEQDRRYQTRCPNSLYSGYGSPLGRSSLYLRNLFCGYPLPMCIFSKHYPPPPPPDELWFGQGAQASFTAPQSFTGFPRDPFGFAPPAFLAFTPLQGLLTGPSEIFPSSAAGFFFAESAGSIFSCQPCSVVGQVGTAFFGGCFLSSTGR